MPESRMKTIEVREAVLNPNKKEFVLQTILVEQRAYEVDENVFITSSGLALPHQDGGYEIVPHYFNLGGASGRVGRKKLEEMRERIVSGLTEFSA